MKSGGARKMVLIVVAMLTLGGPAYAQKSDKDGVTLITQEAADEGTPGDAPGFPVTISESGSYRLGSNLIVPDCDTTAIDITAPNVVVDLNGFSILGPGCGGGSGVGINAEFRGTFPAGGVRVMNGVVRGMGSDGIRLFASCRVEGVHALFNGAGMVVAFGCTVVNNTANRNRGVGISVAGGTVIGNTVRGNGGVGLALGAVNPTEVVGYVHNVLDGNNGGNANPQVTGNVYLQMGGNVCGEALCP